MSPLTEIIWQNCQLFCVQRRIRFCVPGKDSDAVPSVDSSRHRKRTKMTSSKARQIIQIGLFVGFLCTALTLTANSQVKTETKVQESLTSQTVKIETAEVVYVSGSDL